MPSLVPPHGKENARMTHAADNKQKFKDHLASHKINRIGWLRAAILGANDGILSVASVLSGMAAAQATRETVLLAGIAALVAGAASMATGEYVSVSSQSDIEHADLEREKRELATNPKFEHAELTEIYVSRGLDRALAHQVADQLMAHDALGSHARDELGISETAKARPLLAAMASAASFTCGAAFPMVIAAIVPLHLLLISVFASALISLGLLGAMGARTAGVHALKPMIRVLAWGIVSMAVTAVIGRLFHVAV